MSSVNASERSQQTDEVRRMREEHEKQESASTKRKNKELRNMNEKHEQELQQTREGYEKQIETIRNKHREIISDRDERHANDSKKLREMFRESLARKSADSEQIKQELNETFEKELEQQKQISQQQREVLQRNFQENFKERDRQIADRDETSVKKLQEGLTNRTEKLNEKHQKETRAIVEDRDQARAELRAKLDQVRSEYREKHLNDRRLQQNELGRRDTALEAITRDLEHGHSQTLKNRDEQMQSARKEMQGDYQSKLATEHSRMNDLTKQYAEQLDSRTNSVLKKAQSQAAQAKNDQILNAITNRRLRDIEQRNIQNSYQERFQSLEKEKGQIFNVANETARERVNKVIDRTEKLVSETNRKNRMDQNISNMRNREALATHQRMHDGQVQNLNMQTDKRLRRVMNDTMHAQKEQNRQYEENLDILKGSYSENLQSQREAQLDTMKNIYDRMDKKLRDQEIRLSNKHNEAVEFYETKIDDLETQNRKNLQRLSETLEARSKQQQKAANQALEAVELKHKQQAASQEDLHQKEMERLEKRHQEQLQAVVARTTAMRENIRKS